MRKAMSLSVVLFLLPLSSRAAGTSSGDFLKMGAGARYLALGRAAAASADDADALYWNPAGLSRVRNGSLSLMYGSMVESVSYQSVAYARPTAGWGTLGVSVQSLSAGSIRGTDDAGRETGGFSPRDTAVAVGWGRAIRGGWSAGAVFKAVRSTVVESASTGAADVGAGWRKDKFTAALSAHNLGGRLGMDSLPRLARAGLSYRAGRSWLLSAQGDFPSGASASIGAGGEYSFPLGTKSSGALRLGYNSGLRDVPGAAGAGAGLGTRWSSFSADYAWVPWGHLGQTHRISFALRFAGEPTPAVPAAGKPKPFKTP